MFHEPGLTWFASGLWFIYFALVSKSRLAEADESRTAAALEEARAAKAAAEFAAQREAGALDREEVQRDELTKLHKRMIELNGLLSEEVTKRERATNNAEVHMWEYRRRRGRAQVATPA